MPSRAELRALFPGASEAFLDANEGTCTGTRVCATADEGPQRLDVTKATKAMLVAGSEDDFVAFLVARAEELGWSWRHITRSTIAKKDGKQVGDWRSRDIPDLLLWRPPRFMFREVKKAGGRPTQGQIDFIDAMRACGIDADLWYPRDLERALEELA